jgi:hypothetical protein
MRSIDIGEKPIGTTEETISGNDFAFEVLKWAYDPK